MCCNTVHSMCVKQSFPWARSASVSKDRLGDHVELSNKTLSVGIIHINVLSKFLECENEYIHTALP